MQDTTVCPTCGASLRDAKLYSMVPIASEFRVEDKAIDREAYIQLVYKARRIILAGGKVPEIMEATGFSEAEAEEIYREEVEMQ